MTLPNAKEFHEVMELAMDIATHSNGCLHWLHIGLLDKNLTSLGNSTNGRASRSSDGCGNQSKIHSTL